MIEERGLVPIGSLLPSCGNSSSTADSTRVAQSTSSATTGEPYQVRRLESSTGKRLSATTAATKLSDSERLFRYPERAALACLPSPVAFKVTERWSADMDDVYGWDGKFAGYEIGELTGEEREGAIIAVQQSLVPAPLAQIRAELTRLRAVTKFRDSGDQDQAMTAAAYADELSRYPADVVTMVCRAWPRKAGVGRFWPALSELIEDAERMTAPRHLLLSALRGSERAHWPDWLARVWGPEPDGPERRRRVLEEQASQPEEHAQ